MPLPAVRLLVRGWRHAGRRWWLGTGAAIAFVVSLVLVVQGSLSGMAGATHERVADFFTGDVRVTAADEGAAPGRSFPNATAAAGRLREAAGPSGAVVARLESQFVLSRRGLVEAYLEEDEQFSIGVPGAVPGDEDFYGIGVLVGLPFGQPAVADPLRPYLVAGAFPSAEAGADAEVQVLMAESRLRDFLSPQERDSLSAWPPTAAELGRFTFEVTTAHIDPDASLKDVIRSPARVVGLFSTGLDALDTFTLVASIGDVRRLTGADPAGDEANVLTVTGGDPSAAREEARRAGWRTESREEFAQRYVGQLIRVVEALALALAGLFFLLPVFLVWHGIAQQLRTHQREIAVCRAIGVPRRLVGTALLVLVSQVLAAALLSAAAVVALCAWLVGRFAGDLSSLPMPLAFRLDAVAAAVVAAAAVLSTLAALALSARAQARLGLAAQLKAF